LHYFNSFDTINSVNNYKLKKIHYDTILLSDIHFGSPSCHAQELYAFLNNIKVRQIIFNGDVFDGLNFYRLQHWDWEAFGQIRKISDHCQVIWCRGNHDEVNTKLMSSLLGVRVQSEYQWEFQGRRFLALHGDKWDVFIYRYRLLTKIVTWIYTRIQYASKGYSRKIAQWLKKKSKAMIRNSEIIRKNAVRVAENRRFHGVFCGHTHAVELIKSGQIIYGNCGTWESDLPHFIGLNKSGVSLLKFCNNKVTVCVCEKF